MPEVSNWNLSIRAHKDAAFEVQFLMSARLPSLS